MARQLGTVSRNMLVSLTVLGVLLVAVVGVVVVRMAAGGDVQVVAPRGAVVAEGAPPGTPRFAVPDGDPSAPATLTVYEDFQCPACRATEAYLRPTVDRLVAEGAVRVEYHPIAFLDNASTTDYSSRALGAAACVLDTAGDDAYLRMHDLLFLNQPPEGSAGLSDDQLADLAQQAGADRGAVADCMGQGRFAGWVVAATEQASEEGVTQTPTLLVDGTLLELTQNQDPRVTLERAVEAVS